MVTSYLVPLFGTIRSECLYLRPLRPLPPPPPPPPLAASPRPIVGGSGDGVPSFLEDIRKGTLLKKVPESLKDDRSAALPSGRADRKGNQSDPPAGDGDPSTSLLVELRAKLGAKLSQGESQPKSTAAQQSCEKSNLGGPTSQANSVQCKASTNSFQATQPFRGSNVVAQGAGKQQGESQPKSTAAQQSCEKSNLGGPTSQANSVQCKASTNSFQATQPFRGSNVVAQGAGKQQAPAPPTPSVSVEQAFRPKVIHAFRQGPPPPLPSRVPEETSWESRFKFPDEKTFPPPPEVYRGPRTYVRCLMNEDSL
ncbi:hypothetical protein TcWFU_010371 [Taenia crassiceps]|uniref:WH2 domain-containing protein n=1 Tax=Taenia crassiceps TaxID=6207 RepID=A0ABR4Q3F5_9CEST